MRDDAVRVLSFVFIIAQSDTWSRDNLISRLQKIGLEKLLFE